VLIVIPPLLQTLHHRLTLLTHSTSYSHHSGSSSRLQVAPELFNPAPVRGHARRQSAAATTLESQRRRARSWAHLRLGAAQPEAFIQRRTGYSTMQNTLFVWWGEPHSYQAKAILGANKEQGLHVSVTAIVATCNLLLNKAIPFGRGQATPLHFPCRPHYY